MLDTRCLDEWVKVYQLNRHVEVPSLLPLWERLRIQCKQALRSSVRAHDLRSAVAKSARLIFRRISRHDQRVLQHSYVSMFFKPIRGFTRFQRITVTFSILFGSMCGRVDDERFPPNSAARTGSAHSHQHVAALTSA